MLVAVILLLASTVVGCARVADSGPCDMKEWLTERTGWSFRVLGVKSRGTDDFTAILMSGSDMSSMRICGDCAKLYPTTGAAVLHIQNGVCEWWTNILHPTSAVVYPPFTSTSQFETPPPPPPETPPPANDDGRRRRRYQ